MTPTARPDAVRDVVDDDLPCADCGYLLRGLDPAGRCPECNRSVADSRLAQSLAPGRRALASLTRGTIALLVAVAMYPAAHAVAFAGGHRNIGSFFINPHGVRYLVIAALLFAPSWWLARADRLGGASSPPSRAAAATRWLAVALTIVLAALAVSMFVLLEVQLTRHSNAVLLAAYGVAPILIAVEVLLLAGLLLRAAARVPRRPPGWWARVPLVALGFVLLTDAVAWVPITGWRILAHYGLFTPSANRQVPAWVERIIQPVFRTTSHLLQPLLMATVVALLCYAVALHRRTRYLGANTSTSPSPSGG